jgi:terminase small subunit-like protein
VETKELLLTALMNGRTLVDVCGDPDMQDHTTINRWGATDRDGFPERYRQALEIGRLHQAAVPYSAEVADRILDELMGGRPQVEICNEPDMPAASSVRHRVKDNREGFAARYRQPGGRLGHHRGPDAADRRRLPQRLDDAASGRRHHGSHPRSPARQPREAARQDPVLAVVEKAAEIFGDRADLIARQEANRDFNSELAEMYKLIDGRIRGLPSEDEPLDEE